MHLDPHVAIAAVATLGAGWLMIAGGPREERTRAPPEEARLPVLRSRDSRSRVRQLRRLALVLSLALQPLSDAPGCLA